MATLERSSPTLPTLPGAYFYDPAIYAREQERIFGQLWVCAGHHDRLPDAGDYLTTEIAGESVLVVRDTGGDLHAFLNVCRHRGAQLCPAATGQVKGAFRCHYHAWSYALDGRLIGAPNLADAAGFDHAAHGLIPVRIALWEGLIFLNLSESDLPSLTDQVERAIDERFNDRMLFPRYHLDSLRIARTIEYDVPANWKIAIENFLECYHCAPMHPELCDLLPGFRAGAAYQAGVGTEFRPGVEAFTISGKASRPPLSGLTPEDQRRYYGLVLLPGTFINLLPDHVVIHTLTPRGPAATRIRCDWLFDPQTMARSDFSPDDAVELFDLVNRQDWEICALAQRGMRSRAYRQGGVFVPLEHHIRRFNDFIVAMTEDA